MQMAFTFIVVVAGLILSLTVALLAEELIFRQVLALFFVRRAVSAKAGQKR
jgi:membrane protease YdiL (CAAX protease family)